MPEHRMLRERATPLRPGTLRRSCHRVSRLAPIPAPLFLIHGSGPRGSGAQPASGVGREDRRLAILARSCRGSRRDLRCPEDDAVIEVAISVAMTTSDAMIGILGYQALFSYTM